MKQLQCQTCRKQWIVKDEDLNVLKYCPYCGTGVQKEISFEKIDSLDQLIFTATNRLGTDSFNDLNRFIAIMADLAPNLKKELRIFSKNISGEYATYAKQIVTGDFNDAESVTNKLRYLLMEEEGLNESWANMLCDGLYGAAKFIHGGAPRKITNLIIEDFLLTNNEKQMLMNNQSVIDEVPSIPEINSFVNLETSSSNTHKYQIGDIIEFGSYPYEKNGTKKPIQWRVLDKNSDRLLLITEMAIDTKPYNSINEEITWQTCTLRSWLNSEFLNEAFSNEEQKQILITKVKATPNPHYDQRYHDAGRGTYDKVFLLSIQQAKSYFRTAVDRQTNASPYAKSNGASVNNNGNSWWWLRSPGNSSRSAAYVLIGGSISYDGSYVSNDYGAVRPALWLKIDNR